jgi:hypothetical protein
MGFVCRVCGEFHAERLLDIRTGLPDPIFELSDGERAERASLADDFAVLDNRRFFVRGLLEIPIPELETAFGYGVWLEVGQAQFTHLIEHWQSPDQFDAFEGVLANELGPNTGTTGLHAHARPVAADKLPAVTLSDGDHDLIRDQQSGVSAERSDELAAVVQHA